LVCFFKFKGGCSQKKDEKKSKGKLLTGEDQSLRPKDVKKLKRPEQLRWYPKPSKYKHRWVSNIKGQQLLKGVKTNFEKKRKDRRGGEI